MYGPLNWPITARVPTKRYNKLTYTLYFPLIFHCTCFVINIVFMLSSGKMIEIKIKHYIHCTRWVDTSNENLDADNLWQITHVPSSADGIVRGSSRLKGEEFKFGFKTVLVESKVSASSLLLFCFLLLLLLLLFAGGSVNNRIKHKVTPSNLGDSSKLHDIIELKFL